MDGTDDNTQLNGKRGWGIPFDDHPVGALYLRCVEHALAPLFDVCDVLVQGVVVSTTRKRAWLASIRW